MHAAAPLPQLIAPPLTVPFPETVTVSWAVNGDAVPPVKVAVTVFAEVIATLHAPVPVQAPPQPLNVAPLSGAAVRVTTTFGVSLALQMTAPGPAADAAARDPSVAAHRHRQRRAGGATRRRRTGARAAREDRVDALLAAHQDGAGRRGAPAGAGPTGEASSPRPASRSG